MNIDKNNPLNIWLLSTDKIVIDSSKRNVTHFMLNGGKIDLSNSHDEFQIEYSKHINYKNCIVERKTDFFKFFIDFDILSEEIINLDEYVNIIQNTLMNLYKNLNLLCIITGADKVKKITKNEISYLKQGFHLHWPELIVDKETAKRIRKNLIVNLTNVFGKNDKHYDTWEKIIDKCVYEMNGLRLVGSDKCVISDGKPEYENRIYVFKDVYIGNKKDESLFEIYNSDTLKLVKDTSIRSNEKHITEFYNLTEYTETEEASENTTSNLISIAKSSNEYTAIEKYFRLNANGYRVEDIRSISKSKDKPMYLINSRSKWCNNKQDYHTNNHIYFKLTPSGLCQKCMSESVCIYGPCREFQSTCVPITTSLESVLGWKKPKTKDTDKIKKPQNFNVSSFLEKLENNITGKDVFSGPGKKK
tara:strand:- start:1200 stop:2450 length:1251 start_codon:yes stop_codon:yes gene_type:complete